MLARACFERVVERRLSIALPGIGFSHSQLPSTISSGHFMYMASPTTEDTILVIGMCARRRSWSMLGGRRGGLGGSSSDRSGSWRHSGRHQAAEAAKASPKTRQGTERRRARGATHTVVRRTRAQKIVENVTYFQHLQNE